MLEILLLRWLLLYDNIEFVYEGHSIKKYGDVHDLRKTIRKSGQDMSGLNKAVVSSVAKYIDRKARDAGPAFDIICRFKSERNREVHSLPTFIAAKKAVEYYCEIAMMFNVKKRNTFGVLF